MVPWARAVLWPVRVETPGRSVIATESHKGEVWKDSEKRYRSTRCLHIEGTSAIIIELSWLDIVDEAVYFHRLDIFKSARATCLQLTGS